MLCSIAQYENIFSCYKQGKNDFDRAKTRKMGENNADTTSECVAESQISQGCDGPPQIQKRNYQSLYEGTTTETEKPIKKHKKVKVSDHTVKNPVSILNEMYKGLKYNFIQQKGPSNNPIFTVEVELNGEKYQSQGRSKSLAKHRVAKKILEILDPAKFCKDDVDSGFGSEGNGSIGGGELIEIANTSFCRSVTFVQ